MRQYLGISEQEPAAPFIRLISPTDIQEVAWDMAEIIADNHSWDWVNPTMWRIVGFEGGNIIDFLRRYILIARIWRVPLSPDTAADYKQYFLQNYDYKSADLDEIFDAFFMVHDAGMIPDTIYKPWTYEATTLAQDIGEVISTSAKSVWPKLLLFSVLGIAAYGFATRGAPRTVGSIIK